MPKAIVNGITRNVPAIRYKNVKPKPLPEPIQQKPSRMLFDPPELSNFDKFIISNTIHYIFWPIMFVLLVLFFASVQS